VAQDPWIYREGKKSLSSHVVVRGIVEQLKRGSRGWVDALIQAGELEAALSDQSHRSAFLAAELTDALANAVCSGESAQAARAAEIISRITPPDRVDISPPEGFTYYALHPIDFARVMARISSAPPHYAVIGIRSIGTTLSAMAMASMHQAGRPACRITVRPAGHPYARETEFSRDQLLWIGEHALRGSQFVIIDEGPGRSGSTFLSVAETLLQCGVSRELITMIGSRAVDPGTLCAENAPARWSEFRYLATSPSVNARFKDAFYAGGGCWREFFFSDERDWPESWTQTERLKFISPDRTTLSKFEGMGRIGADTRERAFVLSHSGFGPSVTDAGDGFLAYSLLEGKQLRASDRDSSLLDTMARYCAFRASNFSQAPHAPSQLQQMVEFNLQQEFGVHLVFADGEFDSRRPVLVDGRMQPHEWIATSTGEFVKTDAIDHGDDHFFPGPCGIEWDLAGIAVEWGLNSSELRRLSQEVSRLSGIDISKRLPSYLLAYAVFRLSFCRMARNSVRGSAEEPRLAEAYSRYQKTAVRLLESRVRTVGLKQSA
jgi:hypothetical protein